VLLSIIGGWSPEVIVCPKKRRKNYTFHPVLKQTLAGMAAEGSHPANWCCSLSLGTCVSKADGGLTRKAAECTLLLAGEEQDHRAGTKGLGGGTASISRGVGLH